MLKRAALLVLLLALIASARVDAQKNCKKGIPCGNTCIAASKTCRVGSSSAKVAPLSADTTTGAWVASKIGRVYYLEGCSGAKRLSPANLRHFKDEEEAKKAGYTRSATKGC